MCSALGSLASFDDRLVMFADLDRLVINRHFQHTRRHLLSCCFGNGRITIQIDCVVTFPLSMTVGELLTASARLGMRDFTTPPIITNATLSEEGPKTILILNLRPHGNWSQLWRSWKTFSTQTVRKRCIPVH